MNNVLKFGLRSCLVKLANPSKIVLKNSITSGVWTPAYSRTLWHMCSTSKINDFLKPKASTECCQCGCSGYLHTGSEKDLVHFLQTEIAEERKAQKMKSLPAELDGFVIKSDMAELTFEKKNQFETVLVSMNVNHSVDTEEVHEGGSYSEEMKAKPSFEVDIVRNNKTLCFACSYTQLEGPPEPDVDLFEITEVTYFEGDWQEKTYAVAADLLDENLYDLFMLVLNEKGITRDFVQKMSEIATSHEHTQYIGLLENVRNFSSAN